MSIQPPMVFARLRLARTRVRVVAAAHGDLSDYHGAGIRRHAFNRIGTPPANIHPALSLPYHTHSLSLSLYTSEPSPYSIIKYFLFYSILSLYSK